MPYLIAFVAFVSTPIDHLEGQAFGIIRVRAAQIPFMCWYLLQFGFFRALPIQIRPSIALSVSFRGSLLKKHKHYLEFFRWAIIFEQAESE